ncbi:MAG: GatB/YqeY domain-containing protein [Caldilineales bacterium]|nr:GatB/YqeY domain-containing protein [Caldilineales bacterium]
MTILDTINQDLKTAMKAGDEVSKRTLRMLKTAITRAEKETGQALNDQEVIAVLRKEVKQRHDSILAFDMGGRNDLAAAEQAELAVIDRYLPALLDEAAIRAVAAAVITETGAAGPRDMGKVMGPLMARLQGQADGRLVNQIVRELLVG